MKFSKILLVLFVIVVSACATPIPVKYDLDDISPSSKDKKYNIVLVNVVDKRDKLKNQNSDKYVFSSDKSFSQPLMPELTEQLAQHLKTVDLVNNVVIDQKSKLSTSDIQEYKDEGFHLYVEIELNSFYGFQEKIPQGKFTILGVLGGALGGALAAATTSLEYGGEVSYNKIKLISVEQGNLLWEGAVKNTISGEESLYRGSEGYALETLKGANMKLAHKINNLFTFFD